LPIVSSEAGSDSKPKRSSMMRRCRSGRSATARWTRCRRTDSTAFVGGIGRRLVGEQVAELRVAVRAESLVQGDRVDRVECLDDVLELERVAWASSSAVASRPSLACSSAEARLSLMRRSWTCTGMRIVFDWFATARWQA
jgi:hypothetical protein